MELAHEFTVPADIDTAWSTFMDLERVGGCFPGATVDSVTDDGFAGTVKVKLGPIALVYAGSGTFVERDDAARRAVIEAKGKDKRGNGTAGATVTIALAEEGEGTRVSVNTDLAVTGKPAQFGRGVMQDVSDKLLQQFVTCIEGQLSPAAEAAPEAPAVDEGAPAAAAGPAAGAAGAGAAGASAAGASAAGASAAGAGAGAAGGGAASTPSATSASPSSGGAPARAVAAPSAAADDDALDLGATVIPILARTYAPYIAAAAVGLAIGIAIGRRG